MQRKELRLTTRIHRELNSRLNNFCGKTGLFRSQVERMALDDFLNGTNTNRKYINDLLRGKKLPEIQL